MQAALSYFFQELDFEPTKAKKSGVMHGMLPGED